MRLSLEPGSPDFNPRIHSQARIYLNDELRFGVIFADDALGLAKYLRLDANGRIVPDPVTREPIVDSFFGKVRIELPDELRRVIDTQTQAA